MYIYEYMCIYTYIYLPVSHTLHGMPISLLKLAIPPLIHTPTGSMSETLVVSQQRQHLLSCHRQGIEVRDGGPQREKTK